uniref:Putative secreted protein n=1 Tax=Anopheles darlingi TaxID=43151 RepID=A0A2M4DKF7_ANODA
MVRYHFLRILPILLILENLFDRTTPRDEFLLGFFQSFRFELLFRFRLGLFIKLRHSRFQFAGRFYLIQRI